MARGHGDLVGPTDPAIVGGEVYLFVTFDEGSGYVKLGGLKEKTPEATTDMYLKLWGAERKPFGRFRTDNGGEFQGSFDALLTAKGTHHEWALADRPRTAWASPPS